MPVTAFDTAIGTTADPNDDAVDEDDTEFEAGSDVSVGEEIDTIVFTAVEGFGFVLPP